MNDLTKLKYYLDRCMGGGSPTKSNFKVIKRSYDNKDNQHEILISYIYRDSTDPKVSPSERPAEASRRRVFDEIMKARKVRKGK